MKKIYFLTVILLAFATTSVFAQQTQVVELNGNYNCLTQGVPAALQFHVNGSQVELEFCPNVIDNICLTYSEVHPTVTDGQIMGRSAEPGNPPTNWDDIKFVVEEVQGRVRITAFYADGIDYVFERQ
ncbi:MAG: hypothetical protein AAGN35_15070 [Bacteroidota bacterium]